MAPAPAAPDRRLRLVFGGLLLAMLLSAMDQTVVATALPAIVADLGGVRQISWVVTAYLLAATSSALVWGKLGDLYGRKAVLLAGIGLFLLGSAACGLAATLPQLVAFRAAQGLGGGGVVGVAMAVVADLVPPRQRGRYQGWTQATFALSTVLGPLVGGTVVDHVSWRWVFVANLPLGAVVLAVLARLPRVPGRPGARVDLVGAALVAAASTGLLLVTVWGGDRWPWTSAPLLSLAAGTVLLAVGFGWWQTRAAEPVLPPRLLRLPAVAAGGGVLFALSGCFVIVVVFVPVHAQVVTGTAATASGLLLVPLMIATTVASVVSGRVIARTGRYPAPVAGLALVAVAAGLLATLGPGTPGLLLVAYLVLLGAGFGLVTEVLTLILQAGVPRGEVGTATGAAYFLRSLGASVGVALAGAVLSHRLARAPVDADALLAGSDQVRQLPDLVRAEVVDAVAGGLRGAFAVAAALAVLATLLALVLPAVRLDDRPAGSPPARPTDPPADQAPTSTNRR